MTGLLRIRIHTAYGPVILGHQVFSDMPPAAEVIILGRVARKLLGIDVGGCLDHYAEAKRRRSKVYQDTCNFPVSRGMRWHVPRGGYCPEATGDATQRSTCLPQRDKVTDPAAEELWRNGKLASGLVMDRQRLSDNLGRYRSDSRE